MRHRRMESRRRRPARGLFTILWDDDAALALICSGAAVEPRRSHRRPCGGAGVAHRIDAPSAVGHANAEELAAILDTTAEGILMFDAEGNINSANRSAEALFGYDGTELAQRNLADLLCAGKPARRVRISRQRQVAGASSLLDHGRDALGRVRRAASFRCRSPSAAPVPTGRISSRCSATSRRAARARANCCRRGGSPTAPPAPRPTCWRGSATRCARRSTPSSALPRS